VPNFAIVQNPVNLFKDDADTNAVIKTIRMIEELRKQKVRLIVGDTLARLSAGANENAGQDMGVVIERIDRIRNSCKAHFLLIHHSGKNVAAGARGWSGLRAAVDVEIEVTEQSTARCAEITKDRDLGSKGERIGFTLSVLEMAHTKWGAAATTCVVVPAAAPGRRNVKRLSAINTAVLGFLRERKTVIKKVDVVEHFKKSWASAAVYRCLKELVEAELIEGNDGMVLMKGEKV
jgi:RecA-family ATPase